MVISAHAQRRMQSRAIRLGVVMRVLQHGRVVHHRGAELVVVGRREIREARQVGLDLSPCAGVHVVVLDAGRLVGTVYRNQSLRGLRPRGRRGRRRRHSRGDLESRSGSKMYADRVPENIDEHPDR
jgi:hypothetical protein